MPDQKLSPKDIAKILMRRKMGRGDEDYPTIQGKKRLKTSGYDVKGSPLEALKNTMDRIAGKLRAGARAGDAAVAKATKPRDPNAAAEDLKKIMARKKEAEEVAKAGAMTVRRR